MYSVIIRTSTKIEKKTSILMSLCAVSEAAEAGLVVIVITQTIFLTSSLKFLYKIAAKINFEMN